MSDGIRYHHVKHAITNSPVLMYPYPSKEYHLFTDALNHTWSGVQQSNSEISSNKELTYHPITYQSGTFSPLQLKWSTIVKECFVIIMSCQKMAFYL